MAASTDAATLRELKLRQLLLLKEKQRRLARRKFWTYYPATGPLARHLYRKHMAFFELGAKFKTRGFIAGNRVGKCCTAETLIDTPSGPVMIQNLRHGDMVLAWDGKKKVAQAIHEPFQKEGLHECALIVMSDGRTIEAADHHRILFSDGWQLLSERLPQSFFDHPLSILERGLAARVAGVLHWLRTPPGCLDGCSVDRRQGDEQLHDAPEAGRASSPSPIDARPCTCRQKWRSDDLGNTGSDSPSAPSRRPSILDGLRQRAARFVASLMQGQHSGAEPSALKRLASAPRRAVAAAGLRLMGGVGIQVLGCGISKSAWDAPVIDGNKIVAVIPIGRHKVYDFTVPKYHSYCAGGLVHHNTEGGGGFEVTCHVTGLYPDWWKGHRFDRPNHWWVAGDTNETVRDITQAKLCGTREDMGTGLIPGDLLGKALYRPNSNGAMDMIYVKHVSGGWSTIGFKSYEQGRKAFQGTEKDGIWLDEESNEGVRAECVMRLMTTGGLLLETFTPLNGITPIISKYFEDGLDLDESGIMVKNDRAVVMAGWDDVPHLSEDDKARMLSEAEPHLREARSKGIPSMGSGAIYPIPEDDILVDPFPIPAYWPRGYAMDVGWNRTAVVWGVLDRDTDTLYLVSEHYRGQAEPAIHASAIKARGEYMEGVIDPASRGRQQGDGEKLVEMYRREKLKLHMADNAVEAGIYEVWQRLSTGRLKVFKSLNSFRGEYRMYRRDESGKIVKKNDHLMDAARYLVMSKFKFFKPFQSLEKPPEIEAFRPHDPGVGY